MKYSRSNINGDAGEHLFAARVIYHFGFPCRLQNIDIGIDAEIEITDKDLRSTGNIVKAQIKSTESDKMSVFVSGKHIQYWNQLNVPVVVILVHLESERIFWHCVDNIGEYNFSDSGYKIEFDPQDELNKSSKDRFIEISLFPLKQQIISIYKKAFYLALEDKEVLDSGNYDLVTYDFFAENYFGIQYNFDKVEMMIRKSPLLKSVKAKFRDKLDFIQGYLREVEEGIESIESYEPQRFDHFRNDIYDWD